jgi:hypothetical protein
LPAAADVRLAVVGLLLHLSALACYINERESTY